MTDLIPTSLADCEQVIERTKDAFVECGRALATIRDERLYRADHGTFEDYCAARWGFTKTHANRLIDAAQVAEAVTPIGVIATESQARELAPLLNEPDRLREVYAQAVEQTEGKPTAAVIRSIVRPEPPRPTVAHTTPTTETVTADPVTGEVITADEWVARNAPASAVASYVDDSQDVQRARLAHTFSRLVVQTSDGLPLLDVQLLGEALNEDHYDAAERLRRRLNDWFEALDNARPRGLRAVRG